MKRILKDVKKNEKGFICIYNDGYCEQFTNIDIEPYLQELKENKSMKRVTLRLPQELYIQFRMKCIKQNRSMNDYMIMLIENDLNNK